MGKKYKVVITDHRFPSIEIERAILEEGGAWVLECQCKNEEDIISSAHDADGIINTRAKMTRKVIEALERCKIIVRHGIGVDTVDLDAATDRGILVANVPDFCIDEVATHALALILSSARKVVLGHEGVKKGRWDLNLVKPISRIAGQKVGILGFGRIARTLVKKLLPLGFDVVVFDPYITEETIHELGCKKVDWNTLLKEADYLSIHTPLTEETQRMFGEKELQSMKSSAVIVNTARGGIIDEGALARALREGWIAGAALDVLETEPPKESNPLLSMDKVIFTPHIGAYSEQSNHDLLQKAAQEILRVLKGQLPKSLINPKALERYEARFGQNRLICD